MRKIFLSLLLVCGILCAYDEINLSDQQSEKLGIGVSSADFSGSFLIGPFIANLDFSNQSAMKLVSPFEITIAKVYKFEGESVKKGEVICEIVSDSISNLIYEYNNTKSKLDVANANAKNDKMLYDEGVISQREYQTSYLAANELNLRLKDLKNTINQIGISATMGSFGYPVTSPLDGTLVVSPSKSAQKIDMFNPYIIVAKNNAMMANIKIPRQHINDISKNAKVFIRDSNKQIEIGKINSVSVAIDQASNTILSSALVEYPNLKAGSNIDVFIMSANPKNTINIKRENVTKFGDDYVVFVRTESGFMPTKIEIIKEINNGYIIKKDSFSKNTKFANGAIIVLKGAMSNLGFE